MMNNHCLESAETGFGFTRMDHAESVECFVAVGVALSNKIIQSQDQTDYLQQTRAAATGIK